MNEKIKQIILCIEVLGFVSLLVIGLALLMKYAMYG
jgi:hypothetical protein